MNRNHYLGIVLFFLVILCLFITGCPGPSNNDTPPPPKVLGTASATITAAGGSIASLPQDVQITVPANSLPGSTPVTLRVIDTTGEVSPEPSQQTASNAIALTGLDTLAAGGSFTVTAPMIIPTDATSGFVVMSDGGTFENVLTPTYDATNQRFTFTVTAADIAMFDATRGTRVPRDWRWKLKHYVIVGQEPGANINRFVATTKPANESWSAWNEPQVTEDWTNERVALVIHGIGMNLSGMNDMAWYLSQLPLDPAKPSGVNNRKYTRVYGIDYRWQSNIARNAEIVAEDLTANKANGIDVYGYSMGGLVARWAIEKKGASSRVKRLFTFGTPHEGVPLRGIALLEPTGLGLVAVVGAYLALPGVNDLGQHGTFLNSLDNSSDISGSNPVIYYTFAGTKYDNFMGVTGTAIHIAFHDMDTDNNGNADDKLDGIVPWSSAHYIGLSRKCSSHISARLDYNNNHFQMGGAGDLILDSQLKAYILNTGGTNLTVN